MQYACWKMYSIQQRILHGFGTISFLRGENKVPFHVGIDLMNRTGALQV